MKIFLHELALETTRRCNLKCAHCMRGKSQKVDMTEEIVDQILNSEELGGVQTLLFSGGEPTLNAGLIIDTIHKIVDGKKRVNEITMVTNGQTFNRDLVEAFNQFNEYRNGVMKRYIEEKYASNPELADALLDGNLNGHVRVTFSTDRFHHPISQIVKDAYYDTAKGLKITEHSVKDENIKRTGYATIGKEFTYHQDPIKYYKSGTEYSTFCTLYVTATGYVTSLGDGQYTDMDQNNYGHISDISLVKLLRDHGTPILKSPKIELEEKPKQYVITPKSANVS